MLSQPPHSDRTTSRRPPMARTFCGALVAALLSLGCHDWLVVPPLDNPVAGGDPVAALQTGGTGIQFQNRATYAGYLIDDAIIGLESFHYFPTDRRTASHHVRQNPRDPAWFPHPG